MSDKELAVIKPMVTEMNQIIDPQAMYQYVASTFSSIEEGGTHLAMYERGTLNRRLLAHASSQTQLGINRWAGPLYEAYREWIVRVGNFDDYIRWSEKFDTVYDEAYLKYIDNLYEKVEKGPVK